MHVQSMHTKLDDIYDWFEKNLNGRQAVNVPRSPQRHTNANPQRESHDNVQFSVAVNNTASHDNQQLRCPRATFRDDWLDGEDLFTATRGIFQCCCSRRSRDRDHLDVADVSCKIHLSCV